MTTKEQTLREAFEAWYVKNYTGDDGVPPGIFDQCSSGSYQSTTIQYKWEIAQYFARWADK